MATDTVLDAGCNFGLEGMSDFNFHRYLNSVLIQDAQQGHSANWKRTCPFWSEPHFERAANLDHFVSLTPSTQQS